MRRRMFLATLALAPVMPEVSVVPNVTNLRQYGKIVNFSAIYHSVGVSRGELTSVVGVLQPEQLRVLQELTQKTLRALKVTRTRLEMVRNLTWES